MPSPLVDPTDLLALVLLGVFALRRAELRATEGRAHPGVSTPAFEDWKRQALWARSLPVHACFLKIALNVVWFHAVGRFVPVRVTVIGGALLFAGWVFALLTAAWLSYRAGGQAARLGVVIGRRLVEEPVSPIPPRGPEESSR